MTEDKIREWLDARGVSNYIIHEDLSVSVDGSVDLSKSKNLNDSNGKFPFKWKEIKGDFDCSSIGLKSLEGCPVKVERDFNCSQNNDLKTLKGIPSEIGRTINVSHCSLISLEGVQNLIDGDFNCAGNKLETLMGSPKEIRGSFLASNPSLISLKGGPKLVYGDFLVGSSSLKSLEFSPYRVDGYYDCSFNIELKSLKDITGTVGGLMAQFCAIENLRYFPNLNKFYKNDVILSNNKITSLKGITDLSGYEVFLNNNNLTDLDELSNMKNIISVDCSENNIEYISLANELDIRKDFDISNNNLRSLKGCPKKLTHKMDCSVNPNLKSLIGSPKNLYEMNCKMCSIESLEGCPEVVESLFDCRSNKLTKIFDYFNIKECAVVRLDNGIEEFEILKGFSKRKDCLSLSAEKINLLRKKTLLESVVYGDKVNDQKIESKRETKNKI